MEQIKTSVYSIRETISVCLKNNLNFAAYRFPNKKEQAIIIQREPEINTIKNLSQIGGLKGFLISPFIQSNKNQMFLIKPDFYFKEKVLDFDFNELKKIKNPNKIKIEGNQFCEVSKEEYLKQIKSVTDLIKQQKIQKAVLSRVKIISGQYNNRLTEIFSKLCELFPNAFIYMFKAKGHFWMGATPEPFAFINNNTFKTSSVAGTKENKPEFQQLDNWGSKEIHEQQYVSDHIVRILKTANPQNLTHIGPYVKKAGNLLHLRTDFTTTIAEVNGNIGLLLENLHPTPAVCGYRTKHALNVIKSIEKHDREYYSGFLGPVGFDNSISLFVNLRCMKISDTFLSLYTGGGITIDSVPEEEWHETEIKAGTLLSALKSKK